MPVLQLRTHFDLIILSSITCLFCFLLIVSVINVTLFSVDSMNIFFCFPLIVSVINVTLFSVDSMNIFFWGGVQ